jgi:hypothetical protein
VVTPGAHTGNWVIGDHLGIPIPADPETLRAGGLEFLDEAFRAWGVLEDGNAVSRITRFEEIGGGSTGRKLFLTVEYEAPEPHLHTELFVKFSRDPDNPIRDRGKTQMEPEVRFAALSRAPEFPITVPSPQFADYHDDTGTGLLITERISFDANGIERQYHKCLDYEMPDPYEHYRALITAIARLAGTHRSGRLPATLTRHFPVDMQAATVGEPVPMTPEKLQRRLTQLATFVETHAALVPENVRAPDFIARLTDQAPRIAHYEASVWGLSGPQPGLRCAMPLERQRRQRVVLAGQRRGTEVRADGLGLCQPDEHGDGDLGCHVGRGDSAMERAS